MVRHFLPPVHPPPENSSPLLSPVLSPFSFFHLFSLKRWWYLVRTAPTLLCRRAWFRITPSRRSWRARCEPASGVILLTFCHASQFYVMLHGSFYYLARQCHRQWSSSTPCSWIVLLPGLINRSRSILGSMSNSRRLSPSPLDLRFRRRWRRIFPPKIVGF